MKQIPWNPTALLDALTDSVGVYEPDSRVVYVNETTAKFFGIPRETLLAERLWDLFPGAVGNLFYQAFRRVVETGHSEFFDHHYEPWDRWYRNEIHSIGGLIHVVATDITDRKRAERRLTVIAAASRAFALAERDPDAIVEILTRTTAEEIGDLAAVGLLSEDGTLIERVFIHHADPALVARLRGLFCEPLPLAGTLTARVVESGRPLRIEQVDVEAFVAMLRPESADVARGFQPSSFVMVPIQVAGRPVGVLSAARQGGRRPYGEADEELVQGLADRASFALENAHTLVAERRARRSAELAAERTERLLRITSLLSHRQPAREVAETVLRESNSHLGGWSAAIWLLDTTGQQLELLASVGDDGDRAPVVPCDDGSPLATAARTGAPVYLPGAAAAAVATVSLPLSAEGRVIGGLTFTFSSARVLSDDERTFLELLANQCAQALDRARLIDEVRAASQRKDEFLAILGHELRNPLAPMTTALQLLRMRGGGDGPRELQMIERQTRHLTRLVDDLLDISRITRGRIELMRARVGLEGVVASAIEMVSPLFEERRHRLDVSGPPEPLLVEGDEVRLAQVFQNLLTNAAKYTPRGGRIQIRSRRMGPDAVVDVEDDGDGIAPELLPRIFEPFVQGPRAIDRSQGGLGVGLALVKSLVERHGGSVVAVSEGPGRGSRFTVRLPLLARAEASAPFAPASQRPAAGPRRRVLVVDDNADAAELLADLLRDQGHEVAVAYDGPSALGAAARLRPEIALLDIGLPVMDGYELAERLLAEMPGPPELIALTGYGQEHDRQRSRAAGFAAHLVKPVDVTELLAAIERPAREPASDG